MIKYRESQDNTVSISTIPGLTRGFSKRKTVITVTFECYRLVYVLSELQHETSKITINIGIQHETLKITINIGVKALVSNGFTVA